MNPNEQGVDSELQAILTASATRVFGRNAHDHLFREGDQSDGVYLVKRGALRLSLKLSQEEAILTRTVGVGQLVGLSHTIIGDRCTLDCEVVEDAEVAYIPRKDVLHLLKHDAIVAIKLLDLLSYELRALRMQICRPTRRTIKGRPCVKKESTSQSRLLRPSKS